MDGQIHVLILSHGHSALSSDVCELDTAAHRALHSPSLHLSLFFISPFLHLSSSVIVLMANYSLIIIFNTPYF